MHPERCAIGAHESTAGGLWRALERAREIGCETVQIFVKTPSRWSAPKPSESEIERFRSEKEARGPAPAIAHAGYLPNLASPDERLWSRSIEALADELERSRALGLTALVLHPGAHLGSGRERGLARVVEALDRLEPVRERARGVELLVELTAGQGSVLGSHPAELAWILERVREAQGLGVCVDTCHAFAAGFPLDREEGYVELLDSLDSSVGLERVRALHLNDSLSPCGSRRDRHASLGEGGIGWDGLLRFVTDPRWAGLPAILETPLGSDGSGHARDLAALRRKLPGPDLRRPQRPKRLERSK